MKWSITLAAVVLLVGLNATEAKAQSISIDSKVTSKGSIVLGATVSVPAGWTIKSVEFFATPPKGNKGEGGYAGGKADPKNPNSYSGTMKVPPATYDGQALLTAEDAGGGTHFIYSAKETGLDASK